jgi:hypothetical protein
VTEEGFDAVSSIGLTEHIGKANLPAYFSFLYGRLRPGGRLLNHTITRPDDSEPSIRKQGFINRYVFPDGELEGPGHIMSRMNEAGFEVRHEENLREHYARTLTGWCRNLDEHWDEAVAEVGDATARVWRLYMAGSRIGFESNWIQLHQTRGRALGHAAASELGAHRALSSSPVMTGPAPHIPRGAGLCVSGRAQMAYGRRLMPLMKFDSSRSGSPAVWMPGTSLNSSLNITVISRRARWAPRQKCGPGPPKPTCGLGDRVMSNRSGASNTASSRLADQ